MAVLSGKEIEGRAAEIFKGDTFQPDCLRPAVYDLRAQLVEGHPSTTGVCRDNWVILGKGQRAVLESYALIAMPWSLAGNIGVKYRLGMLGLFVSPGLFVDPGFGWRREANGDLAAAGDRLRFAVTNVGADPIAIELGEHGSKVLGIQFLSVAEAAEGDRDPVGGIHPDPQGLAFFEDLTELEMSFRELEQASRRTQTTTEIAVNLAAFLIAFTILGAVVSFLFSALASGSAVHRLTTELNRLNSSRPWTSVTLVAFLAVAVALVVLAAIAATAQLRRIRSHSDTDDAGHRKPVIGPGGTEEEQRPREPGAA